MKVVPVKTSTEGLHSENNKTNMERSLYLEYFISVIMKKIGEMSKRKLISETPAPKVAKLSSFGFSIPRSTILNSIDVEQTSKVLAPSDVSLKPSSPKTERKFNQKWTIDRPWLRYDRDEMTMYCDMCIKANLQNVFTTGCRMMKFESVKKHENRTGDNSHRAAVECIRGSKDMETATRTAHNKIEAAIISVMKNVYMAAQKHLPNSIIPELNELCLEQGAVQLQDIQKADGTFSYSHNDDIREFQQAIADTITDDIIKKVNASPSFSVIIDESSDISVHQNLVVYVRVIEVVEGRFEAVTYFLGIRQLSGATAEKVTSEVLDVLKCRGIDVGKMSGISTDGAAVMVGCRNGVVTRLKQIVPGLLGTHCIAHRLALSCGGAADGIPYLVKFQESLNAIYKFFHYSPKNMARLEEVQKVLQASNRKFQEVFHTRWLSFEGSVSALVANFSALISMLLEEKAARASVMVKPMTTFKFLYTMYFMVDVLKELCQLSKAYQRARIDFTHVHPLLEATVEVLEGYRVCPSPSLASFLGSVPVEPEVDEDGLETFEFEGHTIKDSRKQRSEAESVRDLFIGRVIGNLKDRFSNKGDSAVISSLCRVLEPVTLLSVSDNADSQTSQVEVDLEVAGDYIGSVTGEDDEVFSCQYSKFRAYVRSVSKAGGMVGNLQDTCQLALKQRDAFPLLAEAAERLLVVPVSTVECERGFSKQNIIKTKLRNSLCPTTLQNLMMISIQGPARSKFDFDKSFANWSKMKIRRATKKQ